MKITKVSQHIGRTIQLGENDYIKLDITKEAELEGDGFVTDGKGGFKGVKAENGKKVQSDLFKMIKEEINKQTEELLNKRK